MMTVKFDYQLLLMKIQEVYSSTEKQSCIELFAKDLGMSLRTLDRRLFNVVEWKTPEIAKACELLSIPLNNADAYYFTVKAE